MQDLIEVRIKDTKGRETIVQCRSNDKIHDLYKKYVKNGGELKKPQFRFDGEALWNWNLTLDDLGIENGDSIFASERCCGGLIPVEINTTNTVTDGPDYLTVCNGLNLFGNCQHKGCVAYNKEVSYKFGFGNYDAIDDIGAEKKPVCPKCNVSFIPVTAGFKNCLYEYIGKIVKYDHVLDVDDKNMTYGGHIDEIIIKNNVSHWISLKITAKKFE